MKKEKKKKQEYKPSKWLYIIMFALPLVFTALMVINLDNDIWYILSEGRYIVQNGIYHIDPLSMHQGLQVTVQNWLSASLFWIIYNGFGEAGLFTMVLVCNFFICLLLYKICMLISDKNRILSLIVMFVSDISLASHYIVSRPQIISFIILLSLIYVLELYIKNDNPKYLIWIPILSLMEVNLHASLWWMLFLFMLPYVIDSFKIPILNTQGYRKKPLFIAILIAFLVGFINPYGYKAITFIFTSYGDKYMHIYINELLPFSFNNALSKHMFILILATGLLYTIFRNGNIRIRYICLYCGTMILGFMSVKGFSHFLVVSFFPFAYFFKDIFPNDFSDLPYAFKKVLNIFYCIIGLGCISLFIYCYIKDIPNMKLTHNADEAMQMIVKYGNSETDTVYSSFNNGGFVEFYGFKPYIDPRAEVYLKVNNKKADIFEENYLIQHGSGDIDEFMKKYDFTFMLIEYNDFLFNQMENYEDYLVIYDNTEKGYRLYAKSEKFSEEEIANIKKTYTEALDKAKADSNSNNVN